MTMLSNDVSQALLLSPGGRH